jgi:hypothetical protein
MFLPTDSDPEGNINAVIRHFTLSAENDSSDGQVVVGWIAGNGVAPAPELGGAV